MSGHVPALATAVVVGLSWVGANAAPPVQYLDRPQYKLISVCPGPAEDLSQGEAQLFARSFVLAHGDFSRATIERLKSLNPDLVLLRYMNSTYTRREAQLAAAERHKTAVAMTRVATLARDVARGTTRVHLRPLDDDARRPIALRASTSPGRFSHVQPDEPEATTYVIWIRIGDELMRVNRFDADRNVADVTRGYERSDAATHKQGASVLTPLYVGRDGQQGGSSGTYAGGHGESIRYCLDPHSEHGNPIKAQEVVERVEMGYDGAWLDCCNTGTFNLCDMFGRGVRPWDPETDEEYDHAKFADGQDRKVQFIRRYVRGKTGRTPVLAANNISSADFIEGEYQMERLLVATRRKPEPITGFSMEGFLGHSSTGKRFAAKLGKLRRAIDQDLAVMPQIANSGYYALHESEPDTPERDRIERYSYAFWLLAVLPDQAQRKAMFGTYAFYSEPGHLDNRYVKVHRQYFLPLGQPLDKLPPDGYTAYRIEGTETYRRAFENGIVLLNASEGQRTTVELGGRLIDPDAGRYIQRFTIPPASGKVLLKQAALR